LKGCQRVFGRLSNELCFWDSWRRLEVLRKLERKLKMRRRLEKLQLQDGKVSIRSFRTLMIRLTTGNHLDSFFSQLEKALLKLDSSSEA
jgi:hypothetical protein